MIVIFTEDQDYNAKVISAALKMCSQPFSIVYTSSFPNYSIHTLEINHHKIYEEMEFDRDKINFEQVKSIWFRRIQLPEQYRFGGIKNSDSAFLSITLKNYWNSVLSSVRLLSFDCLIVNDPHSFMDANSKITQLSLAKRVGLSIPHTIFSNNPDEIRCFFDQYN